MQGSSLSRLKRLPKRKATFIEPMESCRLQVAPGFGLAQFPYIHEALSVLPDETITDGEIVALDGKGALISICCKTIAGRTGLQVAKHSMRFD